MSGSDDDDNDMHSDRESTLRQESDMLSSDHRKDIEDLYKAAEAMVNERNDLSKEGEEARRRVRETFRRILKQLKARRS